MASLAAPAGAGEGPFCFCRGRRAMAPFHEEPGRLPVVPDRSVEILPAGGDDAGPPFLPDGDKLDKIPPDVREAVARLIEPVYRRFVTDVDDPLEKSLGMTVVHLMWLEILQQQDMKQHYNYFTVPMGVPENYGSQIDQHLRVMDSKVRVGYLLLRIRELRDRLDSPGEDPKPGKPEIR